MHGASCGTSTLRVQYALDSLLQHNVVCVAAWRLPWSGNRVDLEQLVESPGVEVGWSCVIEVGCE